MWSALHLFLPIGVYADALRLFMDLEARYDGFNPTYLTSRYQSLSAPQSRCFLRVVMDAHRDLRDPLFSLGRMMVRDMTFLTSMVIACANVSNYGNLEKMNFFLQTAGNYLDKTAVTMAEWMKRRLELTWPGTMMIYIEESIRPSRSLDPYSYNSTADTIRMALNARGPPRYLHLVLIYTEPDTQDRSYYWPSTGTLKMVGVRGLNVIVSRYQDIGDLSEKNVRAKEWYHRNNATMWSVIDGNWKTNSLPWLLEEIDLRVGSIRDPRLYHHVVALHESNFFSWDTGIDFGIADSRGVESMPTYQVLDYFYSPGAFSLRNTEHFKLFFSL